MKINSKNLWEYINKLASDEKVKLNVYYDDNYVTQIYWNGDNFEWEPGRFTSEAFFNPLYDFEVIEGEKIPEKLNIHYDKENRFQVKVDGKTTTEVICLKINELIDYLKSKGE